jgi:WD40 repeat protein
MSDRHIRLFVSSPSDVLPERMAVERVVAAINVRLSGLLVIETVRWEQGFYTADSTFQAQIEDPADCDLVVTLFWTRLGSELPPDFSSRMSDGRPWPSGTVYEMARALDARQRKGGGLPDVLVYRKIKPASLPTDDLGRRRLYQAEFERFASFWNEWFVSDAGHFKAGFKSFTDVEDFEAVFYRDLLAWLEKHGHLSRATQWNIEQQGSPFCGLSAFDADHQDVFFGRTRDIERAVKELITAMERGRPFLLIAGESGTGKSSLARAGLLPRLCKPGIVPGIDVWRSAAVDLRSPGDPFATMGRALIDALPEIQAGDYRTADELRLHLSTGGGPQPVQRSLERVAEAFRACNGLERPVTAKLLLLLDQAEQIVSWAPETRAQFAEMNDRLAAAGVWIVATLRLDALGAWLADPALRKLVEPERSSRLDLAPPGPEEIAEIVRGPAELAGLSFEKTNDGALDDTIVEAARGRDVLPLLQFTLQELFLRRDVATGQLTITAYAELGGLEGAVAGQAERAFSALTPAAQARLPRLLRLLVRNQSGSTALVTALRSNIIKTPDDETLVRALTQARVLVAGGTSAEPMLKLAHEAVLRTWREARQLIALDAAFIQIRDEIETQHARWVRDNGRPDRLLTTGRALADAEALLQTHGEEISDEIRKFIRASGQRARLRQSMLAAVTLVFAAMAAITGYLYLEADRQGRAARNEREVAELAQRDAEAQRRRAEEATVEQGRQTERAEANELRAREQEALASRQAAAATASEQRTLRSESILLASKARELIKENEFTVATALALSALPRKWAKTARPYVTDAEAALLDGYLRLNEISVLKPESAKLAAIDVIDRERIAVLIEDKINIYHWATKKLLQTVPLPEVCSGQNESLMSFSLSLFAICGAAVYRIDATNFTRIETINIGDYESTLVDRDGRRVVYANSGEVAVFDLVTGKMRGKIKRNFSALPDEFVALDLAGDVLVTHQQKGDLCAFDLARMAILQCEPVHIPSDSFLGSASYAKAKAAVVYSLERNTWEAKSRYFVRPLKRGAKAVEIFPGILNGDIKCMTRRPWCVFSNAFGPLANVYDVEKAERLPSIDLKAGAWRTWFLEDERLTVFADQDGRIVVWDADERDVIARFAGHRSNVYGVSHGADVGQLFSVSGDGTVREWAVNPFQGRTTIFAVSRPEGEIDLPLAAVYDSAARQIAVAYGKSLVIASTTDPAKRRRIPLEASGPLAFSPNGNRLVYSGRSSGDDSYVENVLDIAAGGRRVRLSGDRTDMKGVSWSADGELIAGAVWGGELLVWSAATGEVVYKAAGYEGNGGSFNYVNAVRFSLSSRRLVAGYENGLVQLFECYSDCVLRRTWMHISNIIEIGFDLSDNEIYLVDEHGVVKMLDADGASVRQGQYIFQPAAGLRTLYPGDVRIELDAAGWSARSPAGTLRGRDLTEGPVLQIRTSLAQRYVAETNTQWIFGSEKSIALALPSSTYTLIAATCTRLARSISDQEKQMFSIGALSDDPLCPEDLRP